MSDSDLSVAGGGVTRLSVNVSDEAARVIRIAKEQRGWSITETVHHALALLEFVQQAQLEGSSLLVKEASGKVRELVMLF